MSFWPFNALFSVRGRRFGCMVVWVTSIAIYYYSEHAVCFLVSKPPTCCTWAHQASTACAEGSWCLWCPHTRTRSTSCWRPSNPRKFSWKEKEEKKKHILKNEHSYCHYLKFTVCVHALDNIKFYNLYSISCTITQHTIMLFIKLACNVQ